VKWGCLCAGINRLEAENGKFLRARTSDLLGPESCAATAIRAVTRTPTLSLKDRQSINKRECLLRVVLVGTGEEDRERNSASIANQMTLAAELGPIGGIRARLLPPKTARTEQLSTTARDQSI